MGSLSNLGEFGLIRKIRKMLPLPSRNLKIGSGDDAAMFKASKKEVLTTTDMLVEGVHFDFKFGTPFEIGWNAMAANLSDIAAMGGAPAYALAGVALKPDTPVNKIMAICKGMIKSAAGFNCRLIGGDVVSTPGPLTISITVIGFPSGRKVFLRSSARPGDKILITGWPGKAAFVLKEKRFIRIIPRIEEIRYLSRNLRINALIDTSDGISSDLTRICEESRVGALVYEEALPVYPGFKKIKNRLDMVLNGGEDFELLFTTPEKNLKPIIFNFRKKFKIPLTCIGEIKQGRYGIKITCRDGGKKTLHAKGYEHFKS
jgi:thiamine-monophosphate kinase